jgi:two-component system, OmpR family, sensor histidine kinase KdpD
MALPGPLSSQAATGKQEQAASCFVLMSGRPAFWGPGHTMQNLVTTRSFRNEMRSVALTLALVGLTTAALASFQFETGLTHGSVVYLIPVVIAGMRWGIVAAVVASICGAIAAAFFFYPPLYSFRIKDPQEVVNLALFLFVAVVISHLATRLKQQLELTSQREIDMRDLYAFSRRLAVAFDVGDIHCAIEDHLAAVMQRNVVLFAAARGGNAGARRPGVVPQQVGTAIDEIASGRRDSSSGVSLRVDDGEIWLVQAVSPKNLDFGVVAVNLGRASRESVDDLRVRVGAVLADATATLERLGVAHAISEAHMRSQTEQLREALIGSVSHELRTPLASIMGAATVLGAAPALAGEPKLRALVHDVHDEAVRLNNDIQNLLDASRISSDGINPHKEWADPADIVHSALERCRRRFGDRKVKLALPSDLPLIHVDPVLVQQALVQIFDNAAKYSPGGSEIEISAGAQDGHIVVSVSDSGTGLTADEKLNMWNRFFRGERHATTTSGSGLGLWIANAFVAANDGAVTASSAGLGRGAKIAIELPVAQAAVSQMEVEADE